MNTEISQKIIAMIDAEAQSRPSSIEFEAAYLVRVVMDRIKFAMRVTDDPSPHRSQLRDAGLQLLDALDRLDQMDRTFQIRLGPAQHRQK